MAYKALYRTYRPSTFEEVAGQEHIVKTLKNALESGKIAHAYLFAGPRGTGKTTMAKLLAKALNCDEGVGHQCDKCKNCLAINEGSHPDVIEIDAASNNGVEEVRDLIDKVKYSTILGRYKVYIIDEVHMMTQGAFNALLKTLEEPPEHVIFILATTEPHKILPTILSRCQRYDFAKLTDEEIRERIKHVLENEHIDYDEEAVNLVISLSDGGMRDALSILDQVLAYSGNKLVSNDILSMFSLESLDEKCTLINLIGQGKVGEVLQRIKSYIARGTDIKRLSSDLLLILKDILIYQTTNSVDYLEIVEESKIKQLSDSISIDKCTKYIDLLMEAEKDYKNVPSINPLFEITLLKMTSLVEIKRETKTAALDEIKEERKTKKIDEPKEIKPTVELEETEDVKIETVEPVIPVKSKAEKNTTAPSLFDISYDDVKINSDILYPKNIKLNEDTYLLDEEQIVQIMVLAKKDIKNQVMEDWEKISSLIIHPDLGKKASLLIDAHPLVATKEILIIEEDIPSKATRVNQKDSQKDLQKITQMIFKKRMFVYALTRNESVTLQQKFINLKQVGKLPKPETVTIEFIGE